MRPAQAFVLAPACVVAVVTVPDSFPHRHSGATQPSLPVRAFNHHLTDFMIHWDRLRADMTPEERREAWARVVVAVGERGAQ